MKRVFAAFMCLIIAFSCTVYAAAFEAQDRLTPDPEINSFATDTDMKEYTVSFSHSLSVAEQLREMVYQLALDRYKTEEALIASPDSYLAYETGLYLEISENSYSWTAVKKLDGEALTLNAEDILAFIEKDYVPRVYVRLTLASENFRDEGVSKVYIYTPSDEVAIYLTDDGRLIPTGTEILFGEALQQSISLHTPTVKGYIFDGWSESDGVRINAIPEGRDRITLKAHFIPMKYEINYVLTTDITYPFGRADNTKNPVEYEVGTGAKLYSISSPVVGYTFGGWYTCADFSGDRVTEISPEETGDKLFYARWISDAELEEVKRLERLQYIRDKKFGDPDGDGSITATDARYVLRAAVGLESPDYERLSRVDYYNNGVVSSESARITLRLAVGLENLYDILLENGLLP